MNDAFRMPKVVSWTPADGLIATWLVVLVTLVALLFIQRMARRGDFDAGSPC